MVAVLTDITGVEDVQLLASKQFKAKSSELGMMTAVQLVNGDQKVFTFKTAQFEGSVGFAVVETTDDDVILSRSNELLIALDDVKREKGFSIIFFAVVNIVKLNSSLLMVGNNERSLAKAAFVGSNETENDFVMDLGSLVSRKKDFIPAITRAIKDGWCKAPLGSIRKSKSDIFDFSKEIDSATVSSPH